MLSRLTLPLPLTIQPAQETDAAFAENVFFSTREHFYQLPLAPQQIDALLKQQFQLQQASYKTNFPDAQLYVIHMLKRPIGKLLIDVHGGYLRVVDIALIKEMRSKGYGSAILQGLKDFARQEGLGVQLSVDQQNLRAKNLYLKLDFCVIESSATHDLLCWQWTEK